MHKYEFFFIPGIHNFSRIWHKFWEFQVINALQSCICLAFKLFFISASQCVLCRRNAYLAYCIISLVPLKTIKTCKQKQVVQISIKPIAYMFIYYKMEDSNINFHQQLVWHLCRRKYFNLKAISVWLRFTFHLHVFDVPLVNQKIHD